MAQRQPLVPGGRNYLPTTSSQTSYLTRTVPFVHPKCYILAAASPTTSQSNPTRDGWFLSDFFAFNALLKGIGSGQTWLTVADINRIVSDHGELLHGNPYREPRVVLSRELLAKEKLTEPIHVKPGSLINEVKQRAAILSKRAAIEGVPLVLLFFCHGKGAPTYEFQLDGKSSAGLRPLELKGILEPSAQVVLITTTCHSGGWLIDTALNRTIATAAGHESPSISWPELYPFGFPGSIFAGSLINTLTSTTSPLLDCHSDLGQANGTKKPLQPESPSHNQTLTYNSFCTAILESCTRLTPFSEEHEFSFGCVNDRWDDSWTGIVGVPVRDYQKIWDELPTKPYTGPSLDLDQDPRNSNAQNGQGTGAVKTGGTQDVKDTLIRYIKNKNVRDLAMRFATCACPGDWNRGENVAYYGMLKDCGRGKRPIAIQLSVRDEFDFDWTDDIDVYASIVFRFEWAALTDFLTETLELPRPDDQECLFWNVSEWNARNSATRQSLAYRELRAQLKDGGFCKSPPLAQGPEFTRPAEYLAAAMMESGVHEFTRTQMVGRVLSFVQKAELFEMARMMSSVIHDPSIRRQAQAWLAALGGDLRLALAS
ncbi:hypothetical protein F4861DRAFT_59446 [Xylaria intraflava]|nr:hypothetical protein F4861DRAFT_59446 [Xylaria intraflava]